jgi:hypothetical protein
MNVFVDGDILVYRAAFATEYPKYMVRYGVDYVREFQYKRDAQEYLIEVEEQGYDDAGIVADTVLEPVENALHVADGMLGGIASHFKKSVKDLNVVLTGKDNFRIDVATTKPYKGNRTKAKPVHYDAIREYFIDKYGAIVVDGEEADDYVGHSHYARWFFDPESSAIVSIDKDLDMIPGIHYNFIKETEYYVDEDEADRFFLWQLVVGDTGDNIPGIPGMGQKRADAILKDIPTSEAFSVIRSIYDKEFGEKAEAYFDEQASLLWIRRHEGQHWSNYWQGEDKQ